MKKVQFSFSDYIIHICIIIVGVLLDQKIKSIIIIMNNKPRVITSFFNVVASWNKGISFGLFAAKDLKSLIILISAAVTIISILTIWLWQENDKAKRLGFSLVIAGALGNAIDRIRFGAVFDFLDFHYNNIHFPAFNVADMLISMGVTLIFWRILCSCRKKCQIV